MATKTIKMAIANMLEDLEEKDFAKFCYVLRNRKEEPRVRRNKVDGKSHLEITDVLASTFTEAGALLETLRILREIQCNDAADNLVAETGGQTSTPGSSNTGGSSAGAAGRPPPAQVNNFLQKRRNDLIQGVTKTNVNQILDLLMEEGVIDQECNDTIAGISTSQEQMREIFKVIKTERGRDTLHRILEEKEPDLMEDLKKKI